MELKNELATILESLDEFCEAANAFVEESVCLTDGMDGREKHRQIINSYAQMPLYEPVLFRFMSLAAMGYQGEEHEMLARFQGAIERYIMVKVLSDDYFSAITEDRGDYYYVSRCQILAHLAQATQNLCFCVNSLKKDFSAQIN